MTQPGDQSRVTRRVPRQSGVWDAVELEVSADDVVLGAINNIQNVVEILISRQGEARSSQEMRDRFSSMMQTSFQQLRDYVAQRDRERQQISLQAAERFNASRKQYSQRVLELESEVEQCRAWIERHDPMLLDNERLIDELESAKAALEAKHKQAQDEIVRQADDIQQLTADAARLRAQLSDTKAEEAHRVEVDRLRQENNRLRADLARAEGKQSDMEATKRELGKVRAERDKAYADLQVAKTAEQKAVESKLATTREFDAFKRQHGSAIVQPILVIPASDKVAAAQGKSPEELIKLFPRANFARFMVKVVEAAIKMAKGKATSYQLIDAVKLARSAEIDPFYQIEPATPSGDVLDMALSECQSWFTQLMLAFKEKGEQMDALITQRNGYRAELADVDRVVKEASEAITGLRSTLKKGKK